MFLVFLIMAKFLAVAKSESSLKENQQMYQEQLELQKQEYENICRKIQEGRKYRHDMRHHLTVLDSLLKQEQTEEAQKYIEHLNSQMESIEYRRYCENTVINAILCAWIPRAEKAGCQVRVSVELPESLFVEVLDLCIILSNAMENAIHACEEVEETGRYIQLKVYIKNEKQIQIYIVNSCIEEVLFNKKGLPEKKHAKGHGIGLPSIYGVAEKYRGVVLCECKDHAFSLKAVLFKLTGERVQIQEEKRRRSLWFFRKTPGTVWLFAAVVCVFLGRMPFQADAQGEMPSVREEDSGSHHTGWGDTGYTIESPVVVNTTDEKEQEAQETEPEEETEEEETLQETEAEETLAKEGAAGRCRI